MKTVDILNRLHKKGFYSFLSRLSSLLYFLKGNGIVRVEYHNQVRAYEFRIGRISYMSLGPGWAFSFQYLINLLQSTYCYQYMPKHGDCVVDIGAGLGEESIVLAQLISSSGLLYAV